MMTSCKRCAAGSSCRYALDARRSGYPCTFDFVAAHPEGAELHEVGDALGVSHARAREIILSASVRFVRKAHEAGLLVRGKNSTPWKDQTPSQRLASALGVVAPQFARARGFTSAENGSEDEP